MFFLAAAKRWDAATAIVDPLYQNGTLTADQLELIALQYTSQKPIAHAPMRYINAAIRKDPTPSRYHTKAYLKMLDNKPEAALALAKEALKLAKKEGLDLRKYEALLSKLNA